MFGRQRPTGPRVARGFPHRVAEFLQEVRIALRLLQHGVERTLFPPHTDPEGGGGQRQGGVVPVEVVQMPVLESLPEADGFGDGVLGVAQTRREDRGGQFGGLGLHVLPGIGQGTNADRVGGLQFVDEHHQTRAAGLHHPAGGRGDRLLEGAGGSLELGAVVGVGRRRELQGGHPEVQPHGVQRLGQRGLRGVRPCRGDEFVELVRQVDRQRHRVAARRPDRGEGALLCVALGDPQQTGLADSARADEDVDPAVELAVHTQVRQVHADPSQVHVATGQVERDGARCVGTSLLRGGHRAYTSL